MKKTLSFLVILLGLLWSCSDNNENPMPQITIEQATGVVADGDTVGEGALMKFRLVIDGNGDHITNIVATITQGDQKKTMMDFGLWATTLDTIIGFYKSQWETENWTFTVMTEKRTFASTTLTIHRDTISAYGSIVSYPEVTLSFQNRDGAHFFDVETGDVLTNEQALTRQSDVDFVVYYYLDNAKPSPTFSSPGDEDASSYYPTMKAWTTFNYSKWDYVSQTTVAAFDHATNDSLLIAQYDEVWGRRKYKYAYAGWVFPFKTINGKIGLVKVIRSDNDANGTIQFAVKVQP